MSHEPLLGASGYDAQTAVGLRRLGHGKPDGQDVRCIGFRRGHALVLVPVGGGDKAVETRRIAGEHALGWLEAYVLDGIDRDLRPDDLLHHVQQSGVRQQPEHGGAEVDGALLGDRSGHRQRDVKPPVAFNTDFGHHTGEALFEGQLGKGGGELSGGVPALRERVQQRRVLPDEGRDTGLPIQEVFENEVPLLTEALQRFPRCGPARSAIGVRTEGLGQSHRAPPRPGHDRAVPGQDAAPAALLCRSVRQC